MNLKVYKEHDNGRLEDVTDYYKELLYNNTLEKIFISWKNFKAISKPGKYIIIAPKRTGLLNKYASRWKVILTEKTLKARLEKVYKEEEEDDNG